MKLSLLELVQDIMSDMDSDLVNSIDDTPEAQQVAQIVKTTFFDILGTKNWPHTRKLMQLNAATSAMPTHCKIPERIKEVEWIQYESSEAGDTDINYKEISYLYPDEFVKRLNSRKSSESNVEQVVDPSGVTLLVLNDTAPQYWTSFDDEYIVFDNYDSAVDSFLQNSKFSVLVYQTPTWSVDDDFVPDLPEEAFPLLLSESKSRAFLALSQEPNEKAEQQSQRSRAWLSRKAWQAKGGVRYANYGRQSRK